MRFPWVRGPTYQRASCTLQEADFLKSAEGSHDRGGVARHDPGACPPECRFIIGLRHKRMPRQRVRFAPLINRLHAGPLIERLVGRTNFLWRAIRYHVDL